MLDESADKFKEMPDSLRRTAHYIRTGHVVDPRSVTLAKIANYLDVAPGVFFTKTDEEDGTDDECQDCPDERSTAIEPA